MIGDVEIDAIQLMRSIKLELFPIRLCNSEIMELKENSIKGL